MTKTRRNKYGIDRKAFYAELARQAAAFAAQTPAQRNAEADLVFARVARNNAAAWTR